MRYCRDVGLAKFKRKLTNQKLKETFVKHENQNKQLTLEMFQVAV
jgi:hypothetical protein